MMDFCCPGGDGLADLVVLFGALQRVLGEIADADYAFIDFSGDMALLFYRGGDLRGHIHNQRDIGGNFAQ